MLGTAWAILLVVVITALTCHFFHVNRRPSVKLPPCPVRYLPLVGNLLSLDADPRDQFKAWRKQYGDYVSLYFGNTLFVMVSGYKAIKETMVTKGMSFADRPMMFLSESTGLTNKGIAFANGANWKEQRLTTLQILRDFGMGRDSMAEKIEEEVSFFMEKLLELKGQASDISTVTYLSIANCISSVLFGKRFDYDDPRFQRAATSTDEVITSAGGSSAINFLPWLEYLPGDLFKAKIIRLHNAIIKEFLNEEIARVDALIEVSTQRESVPQSFISHYRQKQSEKTEAGKETCLDTENLVKSMMDIFMAGTDTTVITIQWCLIYVLNHPDTQAKIHRELDEAIGPERRPSFQDKPKLPYVEATIMETQRLASIGPLALLKMTTEDVHVGQENYFIPKGTPVATNLDTVLHDPDIWGADVLEFKPERFLDEGGSVRYCEELIPFSIGKRACVGESMAKTELFVYLAAIFQKFEVQPVDPKCPPSMEATFGQSVKPMKFKVKLVERFVKMNNKQR